MKDKKKAIIFGVLGGLLSLYNIAFAADITIESYVEGGLTITLNGDWNTGIPLSSISYDEQDQTSYWETVATEDYISFVDDTTTTGFYLTISMSDFTYTGPDTSQGTLNATELKIIGNYTNSTPNVIDMGLDDDAYTLSILPDTCTDGETNLTSKYTFHNDLSDNNKNYSLLGSNTSTTLFDSSVDCLTMGHIRFDRLELNVPALSAIGSYSGTITLTAIDGTP